MSNYVIHVTLSPILYDEKEVNNPKKGYDVSVKVNKRKIKRLGKSKINDNIKKKCDKALKKMQTYNLKDTECDDFPIKGIYGLTDFIDSEMEKSIVSYLDEREWSSVTKGTAGRMVQQFGYLYNYKSRNAIQKTNKLEEDIRYIAKKLIEQEWFKVDISKIQCIANQYMRNQGISEHVDALFFGDTVVSVSLLENTVMTFTTNDQTVNILLPRRSIVILTEDARYKWKHSISSKIKYIAPNGQTITKHNNYRRISLTYRTVN